jgi:acyl-CoA synthetase (AMP-forming)/AMP-acid ligase II/acyl carrier protein
MSSAEPTRTPAIVRGPRLALPRRIPTNVAAVIADRIAQWPDGTIRTHRLDGVGHAQSYRELWRRSGFIAAGLRKFCRHPGDTVVLLIEDAVDFAPAFWACIRGGFTAVPLMSVAREARQGRGELLREALNRLSNVNVLADERFAEIAAVLRHDRGLPTLSLAAAEAGSEDFDGHGSPADPLCLIPTSGSTGRLKLVALPPDAVLHRSFGGEFRTRQNYLGVFALDSITGKNVVFLGCGSCTQIPEDVVTARPTAVLDAIEQYQITRVAFTSSALKRIIAAAEQSDRRWRLGSLCHVGVGAETVVPRVMQHLARFLEQHGAASDIVRAGYGTTETGILVNGTNPLERPIDDHESVCLGAAAAGVALRIVGTGGGVLAEGEIGEVEATCPQTIFSCYWGEPKATRESFTADGWWRTGDLGRLENGQLSLHGRAKELLIVSGKKFSLAEIDAEIETILGVDDRAFSCAIHWSGEATERLAVVFVAADSRAARRAELTDSIRRIVARRFGIRPSPIIAASLDDIPLAANGKLRRSELGARVRWGAIGAAREGGDLLRPAAASRPSRPFNVESILAEIWREVLDIKGELDGDANFFDLGGDSLRAVMLDAAIAEKLGRRISAEAFFISPTFATLLDLIASGSDEPAAAQPVSDTAVPWSLPAALRNRLLLHMETWDGYRPTRDRLVIGANTAGNKPPLFWVFQDAVQFRQLAKALGPDQPLYALRSGADVIDYTEDEIQALALRYVSEISEVAPEGSIFVGGSCQGAIIALAVAQHLLRRRRHVPLLTLMEWSWAHQPYAGPVLLLHGRDSNANPHTLYRRPDLSWRRAFAEYVAAECPGNHSNMFDDGYVDAWSKILALHMQNAERSWPRLIPKLAQSVVIHGANIPDCMVSGGRRNIAVKIQNTGTITWPAWKKSGLALGNRWLDESGKVIAWIDGRVPLPELPGGAEARLRLPITAPRFTGAVQLCVDVVEEGNSWFNSAQNAPLRARLEIRNDEKDRDRGATFSALKLWHKARGWNGK